MSYKLEIKPCREDKFCCQGKHKRLIPAPGDSKHPHDRFHVFKDGLGIEREVLGVFKDGFGIEHKEVSENGPAREIQTAEEAVVAGSLYLTQKEYIDVFTCGSVCVDCCPGEYIAYWYSGSTTDPGLTEYLDRLRLEDQGRDEPDAVSTANVNMLVDALVEQDVLANDMTAEVSETEAEGLYVGGFME